MRINQITQLFLKAMIIAFGSIFASCWLFIEFVLAYLFKVDVFEGSEWLGMLIVAIVSIFLSIIISLHRMNKKLNSESKEIVPKEFKETLQLVCDYHSLKYRKPKFLNEKYNSILYDFHSSMNDINDGNYITDGEDMLPYANELYNLTNKSIWAVNYVDIRKYWLDNKFGNIAIKQNEDAIKRKINIERIFIIQRDEDLFIGNELFKKLLEIGVNLFYVRMSVVPKDLLKDFTIHDSNKILHLLSFNEATVNKEITKTLISVNKNTILQHAEIFTRLKNMATRLDYSEIYKDANYGASVWKHKSTRDFYTNSSIELHLEKINTIPQRILDIGCGAGRAIKTLKSFNNAHILGIDSDPIAIGISMMKYGESDNIHFEQADFRKYNIEGKFDIVLAYNSLYHSQKKEWIESLNKIKQILTPNGHLLLTIKTVKGNEEALNGATEIETNTWLGCNMPDYENLHHFSDEEEQKQIESMFEVVFKEQIPLIKKSDIKGNLHIVQAEGFYLILRNTK